MGCQTSAAVGREEHFPMDAHRRLELHIAMDRARNFAEGTRDCAPAVKGSGKMSKVAQQHHSQEHAQKLEALRDGAKTAQEDRHAEVDITALRAEVDITERIRPLVGVLLGSDYMYIKRCQAKRLSTIRECLGEKTLQ